ncbi:flavin reductase family protein [Deinococcus radiopugnans]|uniref:Flavin reductase (DIM6/NTAB) family NADH-FMN oxidoreductase RutF n=1 Tax=Deinococcus radiopugnans ATCC 19172 TaxID=585398 RepID=A0A5C4Y259_9DEIO|nr:flavin reductase family protein [Deinococcus radiopugnans]MBB6017803.1 flavin reductase (DIM6/NTAB) family NADH-FMN oxidoreductase RutF [Deinococcus radiopugnans ATCC 19172]TNM69533.1 flavin reductase family protein [Deinococcus radiopugnans ATCC 19172]
MAPSPRTPPTEFRHFDLTALPNAARYKLLTATVVPRPIAWVCTLGDGGVPNLAPYSFFGLMGSDPPIVAFAPGDRADGTPKDTALNIAPGGEFSVNLVSAALAQVMSDSATDFPHGMAEAAKLGIELEPGSRIAVPRVRASPATLECVEVQTLQIGKTRIILGQVIGLSLRADAVLDEEKHYVDTAALDLIGRMGGRGGYTHTRDGFEIARMTYAEWVEREG